MKRRLYLFLAASSAVLAAAPAFSARRPRYGGTLVVEDGATVNSLDPSIAPANPAEAGVKAQIDSLIYDRRNEDGTFSDPGPFRLAQWEPGKNAVLAANENYKGGRPFVDAVEIRLGRAAKDRLIDLELGKADVAEIPADQARRAAERGIRISHSRPDDLIAVVFEVGRPAANDPRVRQAIALSIDRAAIVNFILQKEGEPAGGLLPGWSSGTAFLFSTAGDPSHARELWSQIPSPPVVSLGYDSSDSQAKAVADRIAVNAQQAGISMRLQPVPDPTGPHPKVDAQLVRLRMGSGLPQPALTGIMETLNSVAALNPGGNSLPDSATPEQIYEGEESVVRSFSVVPIAWVPQVYGLSARVRDWTAPEPGEALPLANVWLDQIDIASEKVNP
jgi:hypothetical protein